MIQDFNGWLLLAGFMVGWATCHVFSTDDDGGDEP